MEKNILGVNADWKKMMFDICSMLKDRPRETQLAYCYIYALTDGKMSNLSDNDRQLITDDSLEWTKGMNR